MRFEYIETDRLQLRKVDEKVMNFVYTNYSDHELMTFFGMSKNDLSKAKSNFVNGLSTFNKKYLHFYLLEKESSKVIGWCGYHTWYIDHDRAELGYVMADVNSRGKGYMKEALRAVIDYGFHHMNLNRVEAFVGRKNVASLKLMKEFNFQQEGILREHYRANVVPEDSIAFGLLVREYKSKGPIKLVGSNDN